MNGYNGSGAGSECVTGNSGARRETKIGNLIRLGVPRETAIKSGLSGKSYWRNSKSPTINMALSLEYLEKQGLYALRDGWIAFHHG